MSAIQNFYANKSVLVTGASGTVGKITVEKLLRSCPDIKLVYILMRAKTGKSPKERLTEFFNNPVFEKLQETNPTALNKVILVEGDMSLDDLGLNVVMKSALTNQINVVLHIAANIKYDLALLESINTNYLGTKRLLDLSLEMKNLAAFVHVSTVGVYSDSKCLDEIADNFFIDCEHIEKTLKGKTGNELKELEREIMGSSDSSYVFTKTAAETLVKGYADRIPLAIVRLPGVGGCLNEPSPGFMDTRISCAAFVLSCSSGVMPYYVAHPNAGVSLVPGDFCVNILIAVAWETANLRLNVIKIYNCTPKHELQYKEYFNIISRAALKNPLKEILWYPKTVCTQHLWLYYLYFVLFVILPAQFLDLISMLRMQKPEITLNCFMKHKRMSGFWNFSLCIDRTITRQNAVILHNKMSFKDQSIFPIGEDYIDYNHYFDVYLKALKKYVMGNKDSDGPISKQALRRAYWMDVYRLLYFPMLVALVLFIRYV